MTTAHRPTFYNALGGEEQGGNRRGIKTIRVSGRDQPGHKVLKERKPGQSSKRDLEHKDFKAELAQREEQQQAAKRRAAILSGNVTSDGTVLPAEAIDQQLILSLSDMPQDEPNPFPEDADDEGPSQMIAIYQGAADNDDDDDEDDEDELLRELEHLRRERQEEENKKKQAELAEQAERDREMALKRNPLVKFSNVRVLPSTTAKSWEDDVVFKNQAKLSLAEKADQKKKRFINDSVRSAFHRKFLEKYII